MNSSQATSVVPQQQHIEVPKENPVIDYTQSVTPFSAARYTIEVCTKLGSNVLTTATALSYFHIFYQKTTFEEYDPFTIGCTCIQLASKIVDDDIRIRDIINVGLSCIKRNSPPLMLEPYFTMRDSLTHAELLLMRVLGFKLKIDLPHKYLLLYLQALQDWVGASTFKSIPVSDTAWRILQDIYHDSLSVTKPPELLAAACCHMSLELYGVTVPSESPTEPWYAELDEVCTSQAVTDLAIEIFSLYEKEKTLQPLKE